MDKVSIKKVKDYPDLRKVDDAYIINTNKKNFIDALARRKKEKETLVNKSGLEKLSTEIASTTQIVNQLMQDVNNLNTGNGLFASEINSAKITLHKLANAKIEEAKKTRETDDRIQELNTKLTAIDKHIADLDRRINDFDKQLTKLLETLAKTGK